MNQLPSIPILAIRHLRKRIEKLKTYAHLDTAVTLRRWCTMYGGHTPECLSLRINPGPRAKCDCGWEKAEKELTTFSDEFYDEFRKKAS
jgi:hypothetical protein